MCGDDLNMYKTQIDGIQTGTNTPVPVNVDSTGDIQVDVKTLPSGAATAANQTTEINSLSSIDGKLVPTADASTPYVVLCGRQADGTITPLKCDSEGKLYIEPGVVV